MGGRPTKHCGTSDLEKGVLSLRDSTRDQQEKLIC